MPAAACGEEALSSELGPLKAFGATVLPTARSASHARIWWLEAFGRGGAASHAGGRSHVRDEHHIVAISARGFLDSAVFPFPDLPPPGFSRRIAGTDDVRSYLGNVGGVLP